MIRPDGWLLTFGHLYTGRCGSYGGGISLDRSFLSIGWQVLRFRSLWLPFLTATQRSTSMRRFSFFHRSGRERQHHFCFFSYLAWGCFDFLRLPLPPPPG